MIEIEDSDFQPLAEFPLSWRWTDSRWNKLPDTALQTIQPLTATKADELFHAAERLCPAGHPDSRVFEPKLWADATLDHPDAFEKVRDWLLSRLTDREQPVIVSWDQSKAAMTTWGGFCDYWDDFCYPASDDVIIFPPSFDWVLIYDHCERFDFATKRAEPRKVVNG